MNPFALIKIVRCTYTFLSEVLLNSCAIPRNNVTEKKTIVQNLAIYLTNSPLNLLYASYVGQPLVIDDHRRSSPPPPGSAHFLCVARTSLFAIFGLSFFISCMGMSPSCASFFKWAVETQNASPSRRTHPAIRKKRMGPIGTFYFSRVCRKLSHINFN